jgi:DNA-directed RNA polymerase specialized sigma24 family protein
MRDPRDDAAFTAFVGTVADLLLRTAWLLTGGSRAADDLVATTLTQAYRAWPRWAAVGDREAAVLRLLVSAYLRGSRTGATAAVEPAALLEPREPATRNETTRRDLARLPARTRTVLVLRLAQDLDEGQAARAAGIGRRIVRAELARALATIPAGQIPAAEQEADLRERLEDLADDVPSRDPWRLAEAARVRHENGGARPAVVVAAALVLLAVVAVPLAFRLVSAAGPADIPAPSSTVSPAAPPPAAGLAAPFDPATRPGAAELISRFGIAGAAYGFLQNCLAGSDIRVTVRADGTFDAAGATGGGAQDAALLASCFDRLGRTRPISEQARDLLLADWTDTYLCLTAHGWTVQQPPQDLTLDSGLLAWNAYEGIDPLELGAARATCPVRTY